MARLGSAWLGSERSTPTNPSDRSSKVTDTKMVRVVNRDREQDAEKWRLHQAEELLRECGYAPDPDGSGAWRRPAGDAGCAPVVRQSCATPTGNNRN